MKLAGILLTNEPGTRWEYSHSTDVLGRVIEVIDGKLLVEILEERVIRPLSMVNSDF